MLVTLKTKFSHKTHNKVCSALVETWRPSDIAVIAESTSGRFSGVYTFFCPCIYLMCGVCCSIGSATTFSSSIHGQQGKRWQRERLAASLGNINFITAIFQRRGLRWTSRRYCMVGWRSCTPMTRMINTRLKIARGRVQYGTKSILKLAEVTFGTGHVSHDLWTHGSLQTFCSGQCLNNCATVTLQLWLI